jgi:hypothetical protein
MSVSIFETGFFFSCHIGKFTNSDEKKTNASVTSVCMPKFVTVRAKLKSKGYPSSSAADLGLANTK